MTRAVLCVILVGMLASVSSAQPTCNDIHVVGVEAVNPNGIPQGLFDKLAGDVICVQFDLIALGPDYYLPGADMQVIIQDSEGTQVLYCCANVPIITLGAPFTCGPATPPADHPYICCYPLQPDDPVGTYTITVTVFDGITPDLCITECLPGSWNQTEIEVTGVVPVELSSFEAVSDAGRVEIRWETASEEQNLGFYIIRSAEQDGQGLRISDLIEAKGSPSTGAVYTFTDQPEVGVYFYRLEDIATNGSSTIHEPVRVVVGDVQSWGAVKGEFSQ